MPVESPPKPPSEYARASERPPLLSYAVLMGLFTALFAAALLTARRSGRTLPERVGDPTC